MRHLRLRTADFAFFQPAAARKKQTRAPPPCQPEYVSPWNCALTTFPDLVSFSGSDRVFRLCVLPIDFVPITMLCRRQWPHVSSIRNMFKTFQSWSRRRRFRSGRTLSRFIARDVRRDILIVSAARIDEGIVTGRVRTTNVLYVSRGLIPQPEFEPPKEFRIEEMWDWTGKSWGGLPDGTSIVDHLHGKQSD